ncbi:hypothetical protein MFIFM68171_03564 [Madurella fahalii]|uniref:Uncharacterized protein n=1 Tax=Madurella fahalii TaxID=1157608 RepID=A0ABQ0G6G2_9PEZI
MSSIASPDAGGDSPIKQSGTAPAVNEPATYPTPASFLDSPIAQLVAGGDEHNENYSDVDSLFGDGDLEAVFDGVFTDAPRDNISAQEDLVSCSIPRVSSNINNTSTLKSSIAHGNNEQLGSGRRAEKVKAADLAFPTVSPNHDGDNAAARVNGTAIGPVALNQTTTGIPTGPMDEQTVNPISAIEPTETIAKPGPSSYNVPQADAALLGSDQDSVIGALTNGSVPQSDFSGALLFGPDLQRALFTNGEALSDPQLPASGHPITQASFEDTIKPGEATISSASKEIIQSSNPRAPPGTPPRLLKLTLSRPPSSSNDAACSGTNPNPLPPAPVTPLADHLRADFWEWYDKERNFLRTYRTSYKAWSSFTNNNDNKTKNDYHEVEENLRARVVNDQTIWAKYSNSFAEWKAKNPAVTKIIINIHQEMDAVKAAEKLKADRVELSDQLQHKPDDVRRSELARYDGFVVLMKQSRDREMWRRRIEVQKDVEAVLQSEFEAFIDKVNESNRAEEEREKVEAEATDEERPAAEISGTSNVLQEAERDRQTTSQDPNSWFEGFDLDDPGQYFLP